ncbi:MAG: ORF6C domain-containing protein [Chloroflexales bacterium]
MSTPQESAPQPREQLPITLFEHVVLSARTEDGQIHLALRDLCEALSLDLSSQRRRITANPSLHLTRLRVLLGRQLRGLDFLLLDDVSLWILSVQTLRVAPGVRARFDYVKTYLEASVRQAFAALTGMPEGPSNAVEDLSDLDRIERALAEFATLRERQASIEHSQDRARLAYRDLLQMVQDLRGRVQTLESQAKTRITPAQRGAIYQMVQVWGEARAEQDARLTAGAAIHRCWREINARFGVSTYTDLPAAQVDAAIQFIKAQYRALAGQDLPAVEQTGLEGLDA